MPAAKKTILVVDDEPHIVLGLRDALEFEGFRVISAGKGQEGIALARAEAPDAVILDLMLPDMNGYAVCEELRRIDAARADRHADGAVAGDRQDPRARRRRRRLRHQAVQRERAHRAHARHLPPRRAGRRATACRDADASATRSVNLTSQTVKRARREHELSFYEVELLRMLAERQGQPVSRDEILSKIWGLEASPTNRTVDNFIVKLRKKIEKSPDKPQHILTVYGFGYKLVT